MLPPTAHQLNAVAATLKALREAVGLSQAELARRVGVSRSTLNRFEAGERVVSLDLLTRVGAEIAHEITEATS